MKNRKSFLASLACGSAILAAGARANAQETAPSATPPAAPSRSASPNPPGKKPPSAAALAIAATMRRFDARLSDAELTEIARGIDENRRAGAALNPHAHRLANGDEPVTHFSVTFSERP